MSVLNYKFRLYPTREQELALEQTLDGCRWVYNYFYCSRLSKEDMQFALTELKEQHPWLRNYHSKMLQMVVHRVDSARKALKALQKNGYKVGKLRYLYHSDYDSFTYNQSGFRIEDRNIWLSKIGIIKIVLHRHPINIKQVTVHRQAGKWFATVTCEISRRIFKFINLEKRIGIDVGITKFIHDSNDHEIQNPLFLKKMVRPLRRAQSKVSRRVKGSSNYQRSKRLVARLHGKIANKRKDFLHKISTKYANRYDVIFLERLRTLNMVRNHRLARHILDSGWGTFKNMLKYKAKMMAEIEPAYTSVACSCCGKHVPKALAIRIHRCDNCGLIIDRDYNSSLNILQKGLSYLPAGCRKVTPAEIVQQSRKQEASSPDVGSPQVKRLRGQAEDCLRHVAL